MEKFQGWTPETVDNLTFDQLNAILKELNDRQSERKDKKMIEDIDNLDIKNMSRETLTTEEKEAWIKAGYPTPIGKFLKKFRKK